MTVDLDARSARLAEQVVRDTVLAALEEAADRLRAQFAPAGAKEATTAITTVHRRYRQRSGDRDLTMTLREQRDAKTAFFVIETLELLFDVVPDLRALRDELLDNARTAPSAELAWAAVGRDEVPPLRTDQTRDGFELASPFGELDLWRHPTEYGIRRPLWGRKFENLDRFADEVRTIGARDARGAVAAYLGHLGREAERAAHPLGLAEAHHRDQVILAITLLFAAESYGSLQPAIASYTELQRGSLALPIAVRSAYETAVLQVQRTAREGHAPRRLDHIRAAAAAQSYFEQSEDQLLPRTATGWATTVAADAFGIKRPSPRTAAAVGPAFEAALYRMLPYSLSAAEHLDSLVPAGTVGAARGIGGREGRSVMESTRALDAVLLAARVSTLEGYYRERIQHEQLGVAAEAATVDAVNAAVSSLMSSRLWTAFQQVRRRPVEVTVDEQSAAFGREDDAASALEPAVTVSLDGYLAGSQDDMAAFVLFRTINGPALSRNERHGESLSAAFRTWISAQADDFTTRSRRYIDEHRAATGRPPTGLPPELDDHPLRYLVDAPVEEAVAYWAETSGRHKTARAQADARRDVWKVVRDSLRLKVTAARDAG